MITQSAGNSLSKLWTKFRKLSSLWYSLALLLLIVGLGCAGAQAQPEPVQGPAGPAGERGPAGPAGPVGPAGEPAPVEQLQALEAKVDELEEHRQMQSPGGGGSDLDHEQTVLAKLWSATAEYHRIGNVIEDGYQLGYREPFLLDHCIAHPTDGAMGYHYFNHDMIHDTELDPYQPEGIVYAPKQNGNLRLAAVEWIVPKDLWEAEGNTEPPMVHGRELHILNPALGWYILHAWVWLDNPSGTWMDWNPSVDCS